VSACAGTPEPPRDDDPLCNLLYAALAVEGGASVTSLDERDRYPQIHLDTSTFNAEILASKLEDLARAVRALTAAPKHRDLAKTFTGSVIRKLDTQVRAWKRRVSEARSVAAPVTRAKILGPVVPIAPKTTPATIPA
jgi:hypothetical protein